MMNQPLGMMKVGEGSAMAFCVRSAATVLVALSLGCFPVARDGEAKAEGPHFLATQAAAGKLAYAKHCASCHGPNLEGIHVSPGLAGRRFDITWRGKSADTLAFHLRRMPPKVATGTVSEESCTDILAYILEVNGFEPTGVPLPSDATSLAKLEIPFLPGQKFDPLVPVKPSAEQVELLASLDPVTHEMLKDPSPSDWLHWGRTYNGHSYSPLELITRDNVSRLKAAWRAPLNFGGSMPMPVVYQGVMFFQTFPDTVVALDATSGDVLWRYERKVRRSTKKMGLSLYGNRLFVPTSDLHVIALDAKTGKPVWDHEIDLRTKDRRQRGYYQLRSAPLIVGNNVIQSLTASAAPRGAFVVAINMRTGLEAWRFNTIARPGEPEGHTWNDLPLKARSGGSVWQQGTYDPETNTLYYGVAPTYDTGPLLVPVNKPGITNEAMYTNCTVALDATTGELKWHFQHMQNDQWDLDWAFERHIARVPVDGKMRKVVMNVGKMVMLDALDAETGQFLFTVDTGLQNIITATDPKTGARTIDPKVMPNPDTPCVVCPIPFGARSWPQTSYSPRTNFVYVPITESCMKISPTSNQRQLLSSGVIITYDAPQPALDDGMMGRIQAIDVANQKLAWNTDLRAPASTGLLSTAGGLLFAGDVDPALKAFDDQTGELLWQATLDDFPSSSVVTYQVGRTQYVAVVCGMTNNHIRDITDFYRAKLEPTKGRPGDQASSIWVFALEDLVREWTIEDLASALDQVSSDRSFENGKQLYATASCKSCHQIGDQGGKVGPSLREMAEKVRSGKLDRLGLLTEILEPSKVIDPNYRTQAIVTESGAVHSGVVVHEDGDVIRLVANPLDENETPKEVAKDEIQQRVESDVSVMPTGLLNALTRDDILDLLAFFESNGDPTHPAFE